MLLLRKLKKCIWLYSILGWLDNDWPICRPQWTLTFWVNETFLDNYQQNPMSNDLTKTKPRLFYELNMYFQIASYQIICSGLNLLRAWIGPSLPSSICYFNLMMKGILSHGFLFLMLGIFVMKYLFICKWKQLRAVDDDFLARITVLCAFLFGFVLQLVKIIGPGRLPNNFVSTVGWLDYNCPICRPQRKV